MLIFVSGLLDLNVCYSRMPQKKKRKKKKHNLPVAILPAVSRQAFPKVPCKNKNKNKNKHKTPNLYSLASQKECHFHPLQTIASILKLLTVAFPLHIVRPKVQTAEYIMTLFGLSPYQCLSSSELPRPYLQP